MRAWILIVVPLLAGPAVIPLRRRLLRPTGNASRGQAIGSIEREMQADSKRNNDGQRAQSKTD